MPGVFRTAAGGNVGHVLLDDEHGLARKVRFALVGGACFVLQLTTLRVLSGAGVARPQANAVGFAVSAQVNYALSTVFTWRDRSRYDGPRPVVSPRDIDPNDRPITRGASQAGVRSLAPWATYNLTALVALGVNTAAFVAVYDTVGEVPAALAGVAGGTVVTFLVCDRLIFAARRTSRRPTAPSLGRRPPPGRHAAGRARHFATPVDGTAPTDPTRPTTTIPWSAS